MSQKRHHLENLIRMIDSGCGPEIASLEKLCADKETQGEVVELIRQALAVAQTSAQAMIASMEMSGEKP